MAFIPAYTEFVPESLSDISNVTQIYTQIKRHLSFWTNAWRFKWPCNIHTVFRTYMFCEFEIRSPCVYMCSRECWRTKTGIHSFAQLSTDNSTNTHRKAHLWQFSNMRISSSRESTSVFKSDAKPFRVCGDGSSNLSALIHERPRPFRKREHS